MSRGWRDLAACRRADPEAFFPVAAGGVEYAAQVEEAKAICRRCPVTGACLAFALDALPYGIAGGMTEDERRTVRSRRPSCRRRRVFTRLEFVSRRELTEAGQDAIRAGLSVQQAAEQFEVTPRTASRWAAQVRATTPDAGEGSRGGNRAPLGPPDSTNPLAGTRAPEGDRG